MEAKPKDLLCDLPADILHHILSYLQVKDILRLIILSRSLNETLSITAIPSFCFSDDHQPQEFYGPEKVKCSLCTHVFDFMNTLPQNRPHYLKTINRISFSSFCWFHKHEHLHQQWISQLFESFFVHELCLNYRLPSIFTSLPKFQSLKVLKLSMKQCPTVNLPKMELPSLETLHIESIDTNNYSVSVGEWISQSFPSLKHLSLRRITDFAETQDFTIRRSCLEDLYINNLLCFKPVRIITENLCTLACFLPAHFSKYSDKFVLETCVPLQSLTWVGNVSDVQYGSLLYDEDQFLNLQATINGRSLIIMKEANWNVLIQLFKAVRSPKKLQIDTLVLKRWVKMLCTPAPQGLHGETPISLDNLRHIEIYVRYKVKVKGKEYVSLLERLSNLETLTLMNSKMLIHGSDSYPCLDEGRVAEIFKKALANCKKNEVRRTKGLKKVKLIITMFWYKILVAIGWLMMSCRDLEEIMLYYPSCYDEFMMEEGVLYLHQFQRASPTPHTFHFFPQNSIP